MSGFGLTDYQWLRGRCHRLPTLKHSLYYVFHTACTKIAEDPILAHFDRLIWPTTGPRGMKPFRDGQEAENGSRCQVVLRPPRGVLGLLPACSAQWSLAGQ